MAAVNLFRKYERHNTVYFYKKKNFHNPIKCSNLVRFFEGLLPCNVHKTLIND